MPYDNRVAPSEETGRSPFPQSMRRNSLGEEEEEELVGRPCWAPVLRGGLQHGGGLPLRHVPGERKDRLPL